MAAQKSSGFSLIELMLVLLILLIITGSIFSTFNNNQKSFDAEQANAEANANARFAIGRIKEILESSGNNPSQVASINDQTGGIVDLYATLNTPPFTSTGVAGSVVSLTGATNCGAGAANNTYCGVAVDLLSDLNGNGVTTDDVTSSSGGLIFSQNIVTSEHIQLYLDTTPNATGLINSTVYIVNMNTAGGPTRTALAEFVSKMSFMLDVANSSITVSVTARSNRAVRIESDLERRFRYATLTSVIRIRNMNSNVARNFNTLLQRIERGA
jgi:prepilin-type N-terminal cleavage/methylation domain-containing protein